MKANAYRAGGADFQDPQLYFGLPNHFAHVLKVVEISVFLLFSGFLILGIYAMRTFRLDFPISTAEERSRSAEIVKSIDAMKQGLEKGTMPWRRVDTSSIGFPEKEATLLNLQSEID